LFQNEYKAGDPKSPLFFYVLTLNDLAELVPIQWNLAEVKADPVQSSSEPSPNYYTSPYEEEDSVMVPTNNNSEGEGSFEAFDSPEHVLQ